MAGAEFEAGLARIRSKESNQHKQGRSGSKVPMLKYRGDKNPTSSGGINRPTKGYKHE